MKCTSCRTILGATETVCVVCGAPVRRDTKKSTVVPGWAYFFAVACGAIPVISLGGFVPVLLGVGGASACVKVSSSESLPGALRLLSCIGITIGCWFLFAALVAAVTAKAR